jgi:hypothetical protein
MANDRLTCLSHDAMAKRLLAQRKPVPAHQHPRRLNVPTPASAVLLAVAPLPLLLQSKSRTTRTMQTFSLLVKQ